VDRHGDFNRAVAQIFCIHDPGSDYDSADSGQYAITLGGKSLDRGFRINPHPFHCLQQVAQGIGLGRALRH
jgi:hypothetical protein